MSEHAFRIWKTAAKTVLGFSINLKYNGRWLVSQTAVAKQQKLSGQTKKNTRGCLRVPGECERQGLHFLL